MPATYTIPTIIAYINGDLDTDTVAIDSLRMDQSIKRLIGILKVKDFKLMCDHWMKDGTIARSLYQQYKKYDKCEITSALYFYQAELLIDVLEYFPPDSKPKIKEWDDQCVVKDRHSYYETLMKRHRVK